MRHPPAIICALLITGCAAAPDASFSFILKVDGMSRSKAGST